jgi:hypothetical protein
MIAPINVLRIPSSRVRRHSSSTLLLLATVSLALVLGVMVGNHVSMAGAKASRRGTQPARVDANLRTPGGAFVP